MDKRFFPLSSITNRISELLQPATRKNEELEVALARIRRLEGVIPICMHCKNIRSDDASWQKLEAYISNHSDAIFSHGICPDCIAEHYPDVL